MTAVVQDGIILLDQRRIHLKNIHPLIHRHDVGAFLLLGNKGIVAPALAVIRDNGRHAKMRFVLRRSFGGYLQGQSLKVRRIVTPANGSGLVRHGGLARSQDNPRKHQRDTGQQYGDNGLAMGRFASLLEGGVIIFSHGDGHGLKACSRHIIIIIIIIAAVFGGDRCRSYFVLLILGVIIECLVVFCWRSSLAHCLSDVDVVVIAALLFDKIITRLDRSNCSQYITTYYSRPSRVLLCILRYRYAEEQ